MSTSTQVTHVQQIIDQLPEQAKRNVLFSLVGSLNASIVGAASSVVSRIERGDVPIHELELRDIELLMTESDERTDALTNARITTRTAQNLRDQLLAVSNNDSAGSLSGTLEFMTTAPKNAREVNEKLFAEVMKDAGMEDITLDDFKKADLMNSAQRAQRLAGQRGSIEWIIEHVFTSNSHMVLDDDSTMKEIDDREKNTIECLPAETRERIYEKVRKTLERARKDTAFGCLFNDSRYEYSDIALIRAAIADVESLDAHAEHIDMWLGGSAVGTAYSEDVTYKAEPTGKAEKQARNAAH